MENQNSIKCPKCSNLIDINEVLYDDLKAKTQKEFDDEVNEHRKKYKEALDEFKKKEFAFKEEQEKFNQKLQDALKQEIRKEKLKLQEEIKRQVIEEQSEQVNALKKELNEKSGQVKELNLLRIEIERVKRDKKESESKIYLKAEQEFSKKIQEEALRIKKESDEQNELKLRQKDTHLEQLKKQLSEAQRKAEQGSMQLQGETQELAIEEYLAANFPFDTIEEIKKGQRGGDCLQIVHTREIQNCGKIYYESKRTKDFSPAWIGKFKADMIEKGADLGILVTSAMPTNMQRMGLYEGIWICSFEEFKGLSFILRENVISLAHLSKSQENRSDKMSLLYGFLTSNEFKMQIGSIVDGFTSMQNQLQKEKNAMNKIWKQREKQIAMVLENTTSMFGSIKGIAGNAIGEIKSLELGYEEEDVQLLEEDD